MSWTTVGPSSFSFTNFSCNKNKTSFNWIWFKISKNIFVKKSSQLSTVSWELLKILHKVYLVHHWNKHNYQWWSNYQTLIPAASSNSSLCWIISGNRCSSSYKPSHTCDIFIQALSLSWSLSSNPHIIRKKRPSAWRRWLCRRCRQATGGCNLSSAPPAMFATKA